MAIEGSKRVDREFSTKRVGLFTARVISINPDEEEYKDKLGIELKEDSKATEYLGTNNDGNTFLRVDVWLEDINSKNEPKDKYKTTFFLENKERENKDFTKKQYINNVGSCSWTDNESNLPDWFKEREYRTAFNGEEELYNFLRTFLGNLDYRSPETTLQLEWKKLMKGNVKELRDQVGSEWSCDFVALATIITKQKDDDVREYQGIYNKGFLPAYSLKKFRLIDYSDPKVIQGLDNKKTKDLKPHERFVLSIVGEYGSKDFFILKDIRDYNPDDNLVASDKVIDESNADY